jgi:hypothetical protein
MNRVLLVVAVLLFLIAGIVLVGSGSFVIAPAALVAFGLAAFAAASLV